MRCFLCPNNCGVDRTQTLGLCRAPDDIIVSRAALHFYEEPPISGTRGSGAIFFGGCTMRCDFCQNYVISREPKGKIYTVNDLVDAMKSLEDQGAHNINFVTPTHYADKIKRALDIYQPEIPIVYNTSGYETVEAINGLNGYVDIYLPDYKYSDEALGARLSHRKNYPEIALKAIAAMRAQVEDAYSDDGIMQSGVIIRHLVLPNYLQNSLGVIKTVAENFPTTTLSVMSQFTPIPTCSDPCRTLKPLEYKLALREAEKLGLENVFYQELSSAVSSYTPEF